MADGASQRVFPLHTNLSQLVESSRNLVWDSESQGAARSLFSRYEQLRQAIEEFVAAYGPEAKPFVWRKREVKGSQLRNTIVNLRN
jgi:hypothetical protein